MFKKHRVYGMIKKLPHIQERRYPKIMFYEV